ncbi:CRAL-TRIO domain-containing protein [Baffinella frigidus]|nr:CRAL-TRIO domain-containing protein [Cryptophyta sp. CCMP2293]
METLPTLNVSRSRRASAQSCDSGSPIARLQVMPGSPARFLPCSPANFVQIPGSPVLRVQQQQGVLYGSPAHPSSPINVLQGSTEQRRDSLREPSQVAEVGAMGQVVAPFPVKWWPSPQELVQVRVTDQVVSRYLRAEDGKAESAAKRIKKTVDWRKKTDPETPCPVCAKDQRAHNLRTFGLDRYNRVVLYSCFATCTDRKPSALVTHFTKEFERAIRMMPPGAEQIVWLPDFAGFGLRDAIDPRAAISLILLFQAHYPEQLGLIVVIDAPRLFSILWSAIRGTIDAKTRRKIHFVRGDDAREEMNKMLLPDARAKWATQHMLQNRDKALVKTDWKNPHPFPPGIAPYPPGL